MRTPLAPCICTALLLLACGDAGGGREGGSSASAASSAGSSISTSITGASGSSDTGAMTTGDATATGTGTGAGATGEVSATGSDIKFDLGKDTGGPDPDTGAEEGGCQKIDFLFVVDNSGSMADEQENLATSFPGFITSIQDTVKAEDYHIMVIDTDAGNAFLQQCFVICALLPVCEGYPCDNLPKAEGCDAMLGTGLVNDPSADACGVVGGLRYMVDGQPNLSETFQCLAKVGTDGDGSERPMEAMISSLSTLNGPGQCNAGFLRKDALLVVTFITDEEDDGESNGSPIGWNASLVAAKYGDEKSIVVLGLIGDPDQPNPVCTDGAEASPRLRTFAESFTYGSWGSICSPDYAPFFDAAVSVVDTACSQFEPPA